MASSLPTAMSPCICHLKTAKYPPKMEGAGLTKMHQTEKYRQLAQQLWRLSKKRRNPKRPNQPNRTVDGVSTYTLIHLQSYGGTTEYFGGSSETNSTNIWARWRAPTGALLLKRPVRYLLESSFTTFFGPQRDALGFDNLASIGAGFELDSSAYQVIISRARVEGRYIFGDNVSGFSIGLGVSF